MIGKRKKMSTIQALQVSPYIIFLYLIHVLSSYQLISTIQTSDAQYQQYSYGNFIGLSMDFDTLYPHLNNTLLRGYINNSRLNSNAFNLFHQTIHMPLGYKYNCSSQYYGDNPIVCLFQLQNETNVIYALKQYLLDFRGLMRNNMIGLDVEQFDFNNDEYHQMIVQYFSHFSSIANFQLMDRGDKLTNYYNKTAYTPEQFVDDISAFQDDFYYNYLSGPGLSQDASSDWNENALMITDDNYYAFATYRFVLFPTEADATIENLLSQKYTSQFLTERWTFDGQLASFYTTNIAINNIQLTEGMGVDGVTNSFAAAIWALDTSLSFFAMKGKYIDFFTTFDSSYQSVIGSAPEFEPSPIYYGLLLGIYCLTDNNALYSVAAVGANSQIKSYICGYKNILIINKALNPNSSGYVSISMNRDLKYLSCIYLQAPSLNSTSGITFGSIYWTGNNSDFVGQYEEFIYELNTTTNKYHVNISYAQVAYCRYVFSATNGFSPLNRGRSQNHDHYMAYGLLLLFLMLLLTS